jgi:hypothetical protein
VRRAALLAICLGLVAVAPAQALSENVVRYRSLAYAEAHAVREATVEYCRVGHQRGWCWITGMVTSPDSGDWLLRSQVITYRTRAGLHTCGLWDRVGYNTCRI